MYSKANLFIKILIIIAVLTVSYFVTRSLANAIVGNENKKIESQIKDFENRYALQVTQETNAYTLVARGLRQTKNNNLNLALINLKKATELEPNYRDAWLYSGIAELINNHPAVALADLQKAEAIDPIEPAIYQFLTIAYEQNGSSADAKLAREKYDYLTKNN